MSEAPANAINASSSDEEIKKVVSNIGIMGIIDTVFVPGLLVFLMAIKPIEEGFPNAHAKLKKTNMILLIATIVGALLWFFFVGIFIVVGCKIVALLFAIKFFQMDADGFKAFEQEAKEAAEAKAAAASA